jgi:hypothetical protein
MSLTDHSFLSYLLLFHATYCIETDDEYDMHVPVSLLIDAVYLMQLLMSG